MTIEEKAKAYDEAFEKAKEILEMTSDKSAIYTIFPGLEEPEDERIRKEIISALKFANDTGVYDKHIAWLEKQGEQNEKMKKDIAEFIFNSKEDIKHRYDWIKCLGYDIHFIDKEKQDEQKPVDDIQKPIDIKIHQGDKNNSYDMSFEDAQDYISKRGLDICLNDDDVFVDDRYITQTIGNVLRWADDNPKQKPADKVEPKFKAGDVVKDIEDGKVLTIRTVTKDKYIYTDDSFDWIKYQDTYVLVEQKSAWSEEDESRYSSCLYMLERETSLYNWFKSIKCKLQSQPQREWTEEDERMFQSVMIDCSYCGDFPDYPTREEQELYDESMKKIGWLKSLKERMDV